MSRIPTHNGSHLWLGGDFNLPGIDWQNECVRPYAAHSAVCHQMLDISKNSYIDQLVNEPTTNTETNSNILDLFFTNNETLVNQVKVIPGISDHETVFIESSLLSEHGAIATGFSLISQNTENFGKKPMWSDVRNR